MERYNQVIEIMKRLSELVKPDSYEEFHTNAVRNIISLMEERGWSQTRLAKEMALHGSELQQSHLTRILNGSSKLTIERLFQVLKALDTYPNDLFAYFPELDWENVHDDAKKLIEKMDVGTYNTWVRQGYNLIDQEMPDLPEEEEEELNAGIMNMLGQIMKDIEQLKKK